MLSLILSLFSTCHSLAGLEKTLRMPYGETQDFVWSAPYFAVNCAVSAFL